LAEARATGRVLLDLTESNPTRCGLLADASLLSRLGDPAGALYEPSPFGRVRTREAVAKYYRDRGLPADPERIVLTTSTSEAYGWLFKLLSDDGDQVLVPQPSYPLFPMLAQLEGVELAAYPLLRDEGWRVDVAALARAIGPRSRAILMVNPNNPTGSFVHRDDAQEIGAIARERGLALIVDEVFADFLHQPLGPDRQSSFAGFDQALCFVLSGLSKLALLPQLKLGWIACFGPEPAVEEALGRLDLVADSYLSVSTAVQLAAPAILEQAQALRAPVMARLERNLAAIDRAISAQGSTCPVRRLPSEAGWYAMIEVPRTRPDEQWLERLVHAEGLVVHPGYFFDLQAAGTMVVSLLHEPELFGPAIARAVACWSSG